MLAKPINVAIVDDHTLFRKTLKNYLSEQRNVQVVIQSPDVPDLLKKLKDFPVDVVVMDIFMPKLNGYEAAILVKEAYPHIRILALSMCTDMSLLSDLLDVGVYSILSKVDEPEELIRAITCVSEGRIYRSKLLTEVMYWNMQLGIKKPVDADNISLRERDKEVIQLLWEEKSNKEIAEHLYLGIRSVEKIRQDLKDKLGVKSTVGLIKYAINNKIIKVTSSSYSYFY